MTNCKNCGASEEKLEPEFSEIGQYKWSKCIKCKTKHLPNGLIEVPENE